MSARRFASTFALLVLVACSSDDTKDTAGTPASTSAATSATTSATTARSSSNTTTAAGCGVTLADVQALLPAISGVTQNKTPDATRCNFTWSDNGARGID